MPRNDFAERMNDRFARFAEWQLGNRWLVILGFAALCVGATVLSTNLHLCMDLIRAFAPDDEAEYYQNFLEEYGNEKPAEMIGKSVFAEQTELE